MIIVYILSKSKYLYCIEHSKLICLWLVIGSWSTSAYFPSYGIFILYVLTTSKLYGEIHFNRKIVYT